MFVFRFEVHDPVKLLCSYDIGLNPVKCRRYDVEVEAVKLFGEDLRVVLKRFRRSPEYMSILNEKVTVLKRDFDDMLKQVGFAYRVKMEKHIEKNMDKEHKAKLSSRHLPLHRARRLGEEDEKDVTTSTLTPVEKLDRVIPGNNQITDSDSNHYRDLGFKFAGDAIHNTIRNMGPDDDALAVKSTRSPDDTGPTTTEHVKEHKVSNIGPKDANVTPEPHTSESNESPEPETPEPDTPDPDTPEPDTLETDTPEPDTTEPDTPEPETPEPDTLEPETSEPETLEPETPEPEARSTKYIGLLRNSHRPTHKRGLRKGSPRDEWPHNGEPHDGEPHDGEPYDGEPHDGQPYDGQPHDVEPHDEEPRDKQSRDKTKVPRDKAKVPRNKAKVPRDKAKVPHDSRVRDNKPKKPEESKESAKHPRRGKKESRSLIKGMTL